jgi:hypothetical protein
MNEIDGEFYKTFNKLIKTRLPELDEFEIKRKYITAIALQEIYGFGNTELEEHLADDVASLPEDLSNLSMDESTISRNRKKLENSSENLLSKLRDLSTRTVYILYTNGVVLPDEVLETHGLDDQPTLDNPQIDAETRHEAVHNWADEFVDEIISPLTFNRTYPEYGYKRYIGLCAHSALQNISPNDARNTASYLYDPDNVPSGSSLTTNIIDVATENDEKHFPRELSEKLDSGDSIIHDSSSGNDRLDEYLPTELVNQFVECYANFFEYTTDMGFIDGKRRLAVDETRDPTTSEGGKNTPLVGGSGSGRKSAKIGNHAWMYQFPAIVDPKCPFVWNVSPIYNASELPIRMAKQLNSLDKLTDLSIDILLLDREYYQADGVHVCRKYTDENWAIYAVKRGEVEDHINKVQEGEPKGDKIEFASMANPPYVGLYPNTNIPIEELDIRMRFDQIEHENGETTIKPKENPLYYRVSLDTNDDNNSHARYLHDMKITEKNLRKIQASYRRRKLIEPIFGQIKDTLMPYCESSHPAVRYYFAALGGLFYNMHALVSRSLSPEHGIPLDITGKELLTGIRDGCLR